jgi:A/G-specific adenine glycosylase
MPNVAACRKARRLVPRLLNWFTAHARDLPWRCTRDPYAIWVSEIMLQQTQVATVIPFWQHWLRALPTVEKLARAKPEQVLKLWEGLGYYSRARNLQAAARQMVKQHGGQFPKAHADILKLPGIGRYTAGAIGSIAFGQARPIVDGNVTRILTRIFGLRENPAAPKTNERLWELAGTMVASADDCSALNQSLMELGATVCKSRQPRCGECPVARACVARRENAIESIPAQSRPIRYEEKQIDVFIVTDGDRYLVQQRPAGGVNGGFWEFPNSESGARWAVPKNEPPLATARHSITRYRIQLKAYLTHTARDDGQWRTLDELRALPFTAAHRKLWPALTSGRRKAA